MTSRPRPWLVLALAVLASGAAPSDSERNANPPPAPKYASPPEGTVVLLADDFRDGIIAPFTPDQPGIWSVRHGVLRGDMPDGRQQHSLIFAGSTDWTDIALDLDVCQMRGVDKGVAVRVDGERGIGVDLRGPGYQDVLLNRQEWPMGKARVINANGVWHHLRIEAKGHRYRVYVNGDLMIEKTDPHHSRPNGRIALAAYTGGGGLCTVYYDNVVVTALP